MTASALRPAGTTTGSLPSRLWVGVTGHRRLPDEEAVAAQVRRVLDSVIARLADLDLQIGVVSPLAEGADRIVAREVLAHPGAVLEVALPLPRDDYLTDFDTAQSQAEFLELLDVADLVTVMPTTRREEAYAEVGRYVVGRCDLLIAVWDGEDARGSGGTAEIVALAEEQHVPLVLIDDDGESPFQPEQLQRIDHHREIRVYNTLPVSQQRFDSAIAAIRERWLGEAKRTGFPDTVVEPLMDWAVPHLARADLLARRSQRRYRAFGAIMLGGSLLAVTIAATQALFFEERPELIWLEAAIMVLLLVTLVQGRRHRLHRRWLVYRSVAEQFRSALFLCAAGLGKERTDTAAGPPGYDTHAWAPRLFEELWIQRPEVTPADVGATSRFIQNTWIEDQITYNESVRDRSALADKRVRYAIGALFVATFVAAVLHAAEIHHGSHHWLELAAIVFPAAAAALHGMRAQREFLRNGERASGVLRNLRHMRTTLQAATDLTQVQAVVTSASALMLAENQDWFGSMRHHDLEIHV